MSKEIYSVLGVGRNNRKTTEELMRLCGIDTKRELRARIAKERKEGHIICSNTAVNGYWLPENREDVEIFIRSMKSRARAAFAAIKSARQLLATPVGQLDFFGGEQQEV